MDSQPQNPEFRICTENFHPRNCHSDFTVNIILAINPFKTNGISHSYQYD